MEKSRAGKRARSLSQDGAPPRRSIDAAYDEAAGSDESRPSPAATDPVVCMILDVSEGPSGCFYVWGRAAEGHSVLVQVHDYAPYLYVPSPCRSHAAAGEPPPDWSVAELARLQAFWNAR
ncbi:hypothetical protein TSOC_009918 [Tetrabaena socialis]|uniref:Uncharacterized protein n=2 Tax=Tetrabaena socialis TaxID=47790 RepID=A0A2J7ZUQ3_9CHLO|nr:hypothetical protein TSOC_009918 [Tetrabaena socialis]|eukprot:PNH03970.1 hypothetical protein TSOC_009918 [Tetrabaena socialis]